MTRKFTSTQAYLEIVARGLLSKRRMEVYRVIHDHGPINCREVIIRSAGGHMNKNPSTYSARLSELQEMGVIREDFRATDAYTGHQAVYWVVTGNLPTKLVPKPSKNRRLKQLETENEDLRKRLARALERIDNLRGDEQTVKLNDFSYLKGTT